MSSLEAGALEVKAVQGAGKFGIQATQPLCETTKGTGREVSGKLFSLNLVAIGQLS